ncbi:MAG: peptidase U34 [Thermoprotei archaeon]|nr:MAG: peptidase U34 [Thermoprotei archaeon]
MCDTLVVLGNASKDGAVIFAKNSDREPNEAQVLEFYPRMEHDEDTVKCTYIEVPQVKETYTILISRPFWMWGAEIGVNEYGVAIGNEAVFTKEPYAKKGLTGMDMLRLALERSKTAREALDIILKLLEKYGQGGNCGYTGKLYYHNSFIIADPKEAWVLETAGEYWAAQKVRNVRSISNALSIEKEWDMAHPRLVEHAVEKGWCKDDEDFSFAKCYTSWLYTYISKGRERQRYTQKMLEEKIGKIDLEYVKEIMRSHHTDPDYYPPKGSMRDICMHAGGLTRPSQTAASYIGQLYPDFQIHWFTATSSPCISLYKPVFIVSGLPDLGPKPTGEYNPKVFWWIHEKLHRKILVTYRRYAPKIRSEIEDVERKLEKRVQDLRGSYLEGRIGKADLLKITEEAFQEARKIDEKWLARVETRVTWNIPFRMYWSKVNKQAKLKL